MQILCGVNIKGDILRTDFVNIGLIKMFFSIFMPTLLELEVYRFVWDFLLFMMQAIQEDYLRPSELI